MQQVALGRPIGARRTVPLTAPMTTVGLTARMDGVTVGPPDAKGTESFTISTPDDQAAVGFSCYVQAGVGSDATAGLSCALAFTVVASLTDYDGDGRPNTKDPAPLDPRW